MDKLTPSSGLTDEDQEGLDPRVHIELEKLNNATNEINSLEATLEEANNSFRASLNETSSQLQSLAKRLGNCIEKARPYYESIDKAKKVQLDCQRAAIQFQRANVIHQAARETIALAEERFANLRENEATERKFDSAWQEMLNHATMKIMEAEAQKTASEREHLQMAAAYAAAQKEIQDLQRSFKTSINKSRPYFHHRAATQIQLEAQKDRIHKLQKEISLAKLRYSLSLQNLEQISEEIHENRRANMKREPGVGAEVNDPAMFVEIPVNEQTAVQAKLHEEHNYWKDLRRKLSELQEEDILAVASKSENFHTYSLDNNRNSFSALPHSDSLSISYECLGNFNEQPPSVNPAKVTKEYTKPETGLVVNDDGNESFEARIHNKNYLNENEGNENSVYGNDIDNFNDICCRNMDAEHSIQAKVNVGNDIRQSNFDNIAESKIVIAEQSIKVRKESPLECRPAENDGSSCSSIADESENREITTLNLVLKEIVKDESIPNSTVNAANCEESKQSSGTNET